MTHRSGAAFVASLAIMACASGAGAANVATALDPSSPIDSSPMQDGGSATMVVTGQPARLDSQVQRVAFTFGESTVMSAIYGHLAYLDPSTGELRLYFLDGLEPSDDFTTWTMRLHPGLEFSDGTPFDAASIAFALERAADPEVGSNLMAATTGLELTVVDDVTLEVTLPRPDPSWYASVVVNLAVGSPTAIEAANASGEDFGLTPVGPGPFMVKEWDPGQHLVVEPNPHFELFAADQPYLDELVFETNNDQVQQRIAIESGSVQFATPTGGANVENLERVANVLLTRTSGGSNIFINNELPPFDDPRARLAIALAIEPVGAANAFAEGTPPVRSLFAESSPFYNPDYTFPEHDPDEAQRLFDELAAEGKPVDFKYTTVGTAAQAVMIDFLIAQFAEYENVTFEPDVRTFDDYVSASLSGEYQTLGWGTYFTNPIPILVDTFHPDGTLNSLQWDNETVRQAIDDLALAGTVEEQREIWDVVQAELVSDMPIIWVGQGLLAFGWADGLSVPRTINHGTNPLWGEVGYVE